MTVYNVVVTILLILFGFLSTYLKTRESLKQQTGNLINKAESMYDDGNIKFDFVVDSLAKLVPAPLNLVLNKQIIGLIVQTTFDEMQNFAIKQLDKATDKLADTIEEGLEDLEK